MRVVVIGADAYRLAVVEPAARGAHDVAADPVLTPRVIGGAVGGRAVPLSAAALRAAAEATFRSRLQPSGGGWLDRALQSPMMDCCRIRDEHGWTSQHTPVEALGELLDGMGAGAGIITVPLAPRHRRCPMIIPARDPDRVGLARPNGWRVRARP